MGVNFPVRAPKRRMPAAATATRAAVHPIDAAFFASVAASNRIDAVISSMRAARTAAAAAFA
ncbi:MAG: hypothetical protein ACYC42_10020 [Lysobacter sp.]